MHIDWRRAKKELDTHTPMIEKWEDFVPNLDNQNLALIPWCEEPACEENIKKNSTRYVASGRSHGMCRHSNLILICHAAETT